MTKACVVPKCRTGYPSEKVKRSVFRVPKDAERYEQWKKAIPGIRELKPTHVVCEKHFNKSDIIREWVKLDKNGEIIAKTNYAYPQLSKLAIPCKFETDATPNDCKDQSTVLTKHEEDSKDNMKTDKSSVLQSNLTAEIPKNTTTDSAESSDVQSNLKAEISKNTTTDSAESSVVQSNLKAEISKNTTTDSAKSSVVQSNRKAEISKITTTDSTQSKDSSDNRKTTSGEHLLLPSANYKTVTQMETNMDTAESTDLGIVLKPVTKSTTICSPIITSKYTENGSGCVVRTVSTEIPAFWSVSKVTNVNSTSFVFSRVIIFLQNGNRSPVTQKSVILESDERLKYYVYGRPIEADAISVDEILEEIDDLPNTLEKFGRMNVCSGIGDIDVSYLQSGTVFQDFMQQWHAQDCLLLFEKRRCDNCMKLMRRIKLRISREGKRSVSDGVFGGSNNFDRNKLIALRLKYRWQRRELSRAKERAQRLLKKINKQKEQIADLQDIEFVEKTRNAQLAKMIRKNQKQKNVDTASKKVLKDDISEKKS